jgi:hypothetical protein
VLPANVRLDWEVIASYKHSSLFGLVDSDEGKSFITLAPAGKRRGQKLLRMCRGVNVIKLLRT